MTTTEIDVSLRPPKINVALYGIQTEILALSRRDKDTLQVEDLSSWSSPVARWKVEKGDTSSVTLGAAIVGNTIEVTFDGAMKANMDPAGYWECDVLDGSSRLVTFGRGRCSLEAAVGS